MSQELVDLLDKIGLGTFIVIASSILAFLIPFLKQVREQKKKMKNKLKGEIMEEESREKEKQDLQTAIKKIDGIDEKLDEHNKDIKDYVEERIGLIETQVESNTKQINRAKKELADYRNQTNELLELMKTTEENVKILIDSDKDTIYYIIMQTYRECMEDREIDLSTLQNVERMYKKYMEEIEDNDDFIEKLMNEMRNLPIKK